MPKFVILLTSFVIFAFSGSAFAQSQREMNETAAADFQKSDKRLNIVYKKVLDSLDDQGKKLLTASQRAWLAFRDAQADFEADSNGRGGSIENMINTATRTELTDARIKQLLQVYAIDHEEEAKKLGWKQPPAS